MGTSRQTVTVSSFHLLLSPAGLPPQGPWDPEQPPQHTGCEQGYLSREVQQPGKRAEENLIYPRGGSEDWLPSPRQAGPQGCLFRVHLLLLEPRFWSAHQARHAKAPSPTTEPQPKGQAQGLHWQVLRDLFLRD